MSTEDKNVDPTGDAIPVAADPQAPQEPANDGPAPGSVAAIQGNGEPATQEPKMVPERDLLRVKDKAQKLAEENKALKAAQQASAAPAVQPQAQTSDNLGLREKYTDVDQQFLQDIEQTIDKVADQKAHEKVAPILEQAQKEKVAKQLNAALDSELTRVWVELSKEDRELAIGLATLPQYRNVAMGDIALRLWGNQAPGATSETDTRPAAETVSENFDPKKLTKAQKAEVFANPELRKKYFDAKYS